MTLRTRWLVLGGILLACRPTTTRPYFGPVTGAPAEEVQLDVPRATRVLQGIFHDDTLPVRLVEPRDGYLESPWFDANSRVPVGRRQLGSDVVRIRVWIDPTREGYCRITAETVYRPVADPSLDPRALDRQVPPDHPVAQRVAEIMSGLVKLYGPQPSEAPAGSAAP